MIKRISIILLSLLIIVTGVFAFRKLNYWERSIWVFKYKSMDRRFEGRGGRRPAEFDRSRQTLDGRGDRGAGRELLERPEGELREQPDGEFRERSEREFRERPDGEFRERSEREFRERPDGEFRENREERASFIPGDRGRGGHGREGSHRGQQVRLRNVLWFIAVFSAFTVVSRYLDRAWLRFRKKRLRSPH